MTAHLVPLTPGDLPGVMRLERLAGYDAFIGRWEAEEHAEQMASPDARYHGFRDGAGLAGFTILQNFREPVIRLRRIAVAEANRGTGTALLQAIMDWTFRETAAEAMRLDVARENDRARKVYVREGWTAIGDDGDRHILMRVPRQTWAGLRGVSAGR